ncbi:MAG: hypothetical protein ABIP44_05950 [Pseudoxanthomonas sp.]
MAVALTHVFGLARKHAFVIKGEIDLDTAAQTELGTGQDVFKGTFIHVRFLKNAIFAPAVVQANNISSNSERGDVNSTNLDFYYVPKLKTRATC